MKMAMTYMLIHILGNVRDVQVGISLIGKLFEFRVERLLRQGQRQRQYRITDTDPSKGNLIAEVVEPANAVLSILKVVILDEPKAIRIRKLPPANKS